MANFCSGTEPLNGLEQGKRSWPEGQFRVGILIALPLPPQQETSRSTTQGAGIGFLHGLSTRGGYRGAPASSG